MPSSVRTRSGRELDREHAKDAGEEGAGDRPPPRREQPAMVRPLPGAGSVRRASGPRALRGAEQAGIAGCFCGALLCLERSHDLLGGGSVVSGPLGCTGVEVLMDVQLRERRAVEREAVGEAERERGEVLIRLAGSEVRGRGRFCLALFAASASVLERPCAVGALGDSAVASSAVISHHGHPNTELYHHDLALDCSRDG
jgi:hypothetical protein